MKAVFASGMRSALDNTAIPKSLVEYLESQFSDVLEEEVRIKRNPKHEDRRVHLTLYFITPTTTG